MDFALTDAQRLIQDTAHEFSMRVLAPAAAQLDRDECFPASHWERLAEVGFLGLLVPEEYGGAALGMMELALVLDEVSQACAATGVSLAVHNSMVAGAIARFGTAEQRRRYLPELASGRFIGGYALTEPGHGSDAAAIETTATADGGGFVLDGRKCWVTNAPFAGLFVVFATVDRSRRSHGITAFLVERDTPGLSVERPEKKLGIRGAETAEVVFDGVRTGAQHVLGGAGKGFGLALSSLDGGRIGVAAQASGILAAAIQDAARYASERRQFGRRLAEFQPIQWKLANMAVDLESARLLTRQAAWLRDRGEPHRAAASRAKLFASEAANRAATAAVQIHGGSGYLTDFRVERLYRDAKVTEIYEGTSEIQRVVIAREVLKELA